MIYLDHAATTPVRKEVLDKMIPYFTEKFGNPSSIYEIGLDNREDILDAREIIAEAINTSVDEIYFTSGGSEADNWAIRSTVKKSKLERKHVITSKIEHHAVLHTLEELEKEGLEVTYLDVDSSGLINIEELKSSIKDNTILITIMHANNEIGTIQPIKEIGLIAKENKVLFHTDAVQSFGHINIDVKEMNIDMLSASAHKIYGPKGTGMLYIKKGIFLPNLISGGAQEKRKRAGTENVAGIIGFAEATKYMIDTMNEEAKREEEIRDYAIKKILSEIPYTRLNGHKEIRLPNNINISFDFIEGESLILMLNSLGYATSSGSACTSGSLEPSHVLLALGLKHEEAHGSLRLTIGEGTKKEDLDNLVKDLKPIVEKLRAMSPLYEDFIQKEGA